MNKTHLRRSIAAVATAAACLVIMANPAAAAAHDADINSGIVNLTKTGVNEAIDLTPSTTSTCAAGTLTVDDGTGSTIAVTALDKVGLVTTTTGGAATYIVHLFRQAAGSTAGTLNTATGTITNMRVALKAEIFTAPTTGCTLPGGTPLCSLGVLLNLSGTYTPTGSISTGDVATLTGTSVGTVVANPTCAAGPSFLLGTSASISNPNPLVATVTT